MQGVAVIDGHGGREFKIAGEPFEVLDAFVALAAGDIVFVLVFQSTVPTRIGAVHGGFPFAGLTGCRAARKKKMHSTDAADNRFHRLS
jgi:hypothetical protein